MDMLKDLAKVVLLFIGLGLAILVWVRLVSAMCRLVEWLQDSHE